MVVICTSNGGLPKLLACHAAPKAFVIAVKLLLPCTAGLHSEHAHRADWSDLRAEFTPWAECLRLRRHCCLQPARQAQTQGSWHRAEVQCRGVQAHHLDDQADIAARVRPGVHNFDGNVAWRVAVHLRVGATLSAQRRCSTA